MPCTERSAGSVARCWRLSQPEGCLLDSHVRGVPCCGGTEQDVAQGVNSEELERAKVAAISSVYMNLESRAVVAEDIGRQILTYGSRWGCPSAAWFTGAARAAVGAVHAWRCAQLLHVLGCTALSAQTVRD